MIEVKGLTKYYGDRTAISDVSFRVEKGEILGFLGQNGAGKTTTMKILTCFLPASEGTATVAGFDTFEDPLEIKKRIGYLPEWPPVYNELLVNEYLEFCGELRGLKGDDLKKKINKVLDRCDIADVQGRLIGNLSKGYRQRVGLAQALLHEPEVLIMDEPTVGLDPKQVSEFRGLIRGLGENTTIIYSTHILSEVAATCDRIIVIDQGRLVAQESIKEATDISTTELVVQKNSEALLKDLRSLKGIKNVNGGSNGSNRIVVQSEPGEALMSEISKTVIKHNGGLIRMSPVQLELEQHYLDLIGATRK